MSPTAQKIYMIFIKNIFSRQNILMPITKDNIEHLITCTGGRLVCDPHYKTTSVTPDGITGYHIRYNPQTTPFPLYDICYLWCQTMLSLNANGVIHFPLKDDPTIQNLCKELTVHMLMPDWYFEKIVEKHTTDHKVNLTRISCETCLPVSALRLRGNQLRYWSV